MSLIKCPECGTEISNRAKCCPNCGYPITFVPPKRVQPNINRRVKVKPSVKPRLFTFIILLIAAIFLLKKFFFSSSSDYSNQQELENTAIDTSNSFEDLSNNQALPSANEFAYSIDGNTIYLEKYEGSDRILTIEPNYVIDGVSYSVNLDSFQVDSRTVNTLIISDGIASINDAIFNGCNVTTIFFPKSLSVIYDNTLAYLNEDHIDIYYEGSSDDWNNIFQIYEIDSVSEKFEEGDASGAGKALADKLNHFIGHKYDDSKFTYYFNSNIDSVK